MKIFVYKKNADGAYVGTKTIYDVDLVQILDDATVVRTSKEDYIFERDMYFLEVQSAH